MFWNGTRWVDERAATPTARKGSPRKLRDVLATVPMLLLVPALLFPFLSVGAGGYSPTLTVSGMFAPGGSLTVSGSGFPSKEWIDLRWDGASTGTSVRVDSRNTFRSQLTVPSGTASGGHEISAYASGRNGRSSAELIASASVQIDGGTSTPTPPPSSSPTPAPTPVPTPIATPTPTPTTSARIVSVLATGVTQTGATITWTVSEAATGQVEYGRTTAYGTLSTPELSFIWSTHIQALSGLTAGTTYHYRVHSRTAAGVSLVSNDFAFTTLGSTIVAPTPTPTPAPTATPTPTPTPTPTATPTPPSASRPFPAPVTTRTVTVPSTINATGSVDVTSALNAFVASVPNGSIISFPANGIYRVTQGIYLRGRNNLVFEGNGSTIRSYGAGDSTASSGFKLDNLNSDIAIRNFKVVGNNPNTTTLYSAGTESQMGVAIYDGARIEIDNIDVKNVYGDGVFIAGKQSSPYRSSDRIWIHDSSFDYIGRMGLVFNAATNSVAERNYYSHIGLFVLDIESDYDFEVVDNVTFRNNSVGSYGLTPTYTNYFFACSGNQAVAQVSNVYVTGNTVSQGAPTSSPYNTAQKGGLASYVERGNRIRNIVFSGNSTSKSGAGAVLYFNRVDGLTVTNNVQPLVSGPVASILNSTAVTYEP